MSKYPECFQNIAQHMVDVTDDDDGGGDFSVVCLE